MPDLLPRSVRVFVSSTFRDFFAERDRLARFAFPRLRRACEERAVMFTEVDLRWGITDEQAAEGEVLPICLSEIDASRPFFIGLLGERYGWVAGAIPDELIERHPWLAERRTRSVTELEILHGVLNCPRMADRSFFYFRDREASLRLGEEGASESVTAAERLSDLKARIRSSGLPVREGFGTPEELEAAVVSDLTSAIGALFPLAGAPDALEQERLVHDAFGYELASSFVPRLALLSALDAHAAGMGAPLLVTGESGSGKTALLAHWARAQVSRPNQKPIVVHFCGASAAAGDWSTLVRRVGAELTRATGVAAAFPDEPNALRDAFKRHLFQAAEAKPFVLVIDGADQLEDREGALDLSFLPPVPPTRCRLVLSAVVGTRPAQEAQRREWGSLVVDSLESAQRREVLQSLLSRRAKGLDASRMDRICEAPGAESPLFLSVLADELSVVASHETFDAMLDRYLPIDTAGNLYERVLERFERDYDTRNGLVRDTLTAIWASRRGLSERELLEILGHDSPLPQVQLAPLLLAAGRQLTSRGGRLNYTHALMARAVENRFLRDEAEKLEVHRLLATHFDRDRMSMRSVDELPWHLYEAREWNRLAALLAHVEFLDLAWRVNADQVLRYWTAIERESTLRVTAAYRDALGGPAGWRGDQRRILHLLIAMGYLEDAATLCESQATLHRQPGNQDALKDTLECWAVVCRDLGHWDRALTLLSELERLSEESGDFIGLSAALGYQAEIVDARGDSDRAEELVNRKEIIGRFFGDVEGILAALLLKAVILEDRGYLDDALAVLEEAESLSRAQGDLSGLQASRGNQANIAAAQGDLKRALAIFTELERGYRDIGDRGALASTLANMSLLQDLSGDRLSAVSLAQEAERIWREMGSPAGMKCVLEPTVMISRQPEGHGAPPMLEEEERICRQRGDMKALQRLLGICGGILQGAGDLDGAIDRFREQERICRSCGQAVGLAIALSGQASVFRLRGDYASSLSCLEEQLRICDDLGYRVGRANTLGMLADIFLALNDTARAVKLLDEEARIFREVGNAGGLVAALENQARLLHITGDLDAAMAISEEWLRISRRIGDMEGLQGALGTRARILLARGNEVEAMALFKEQERICRGMGYRQGLGESLGGQARILQVRGVLDRAIANYREQESICREIGDFEGLGEALGGQGLVLHALGSSDRAVTILTEAQRILRESDSAGKLQESLGDLGVVFISRGEFDRAIPLLEEQVRICRESGIPSGLELGLSNHAECLLTLGRPRDALPLCEEAVEVARRHNSSGLAESVALAARVRDALAGLAAGG